MKMEKKKISIEERAKAYFLRPGFRRVLERIWGRYASLGKTGGHAVLSNPTHDECEAVNAFMGWNKKQGETLRIPLKKFEQELLESAFSCTIAELHESLTGEPLLTREERKQQANHDWEECFKEVKNKLTKLVPSAVPSIVLDWLDGLRSGSGEVEGSRTFREVWSQSPPFARQELLRALKSWCMLLADGSLDAYRGGRSTAGIRLPILAALATGDAHALDRNVPAGRLFFHALQFAMKSHKNVVLAEEEGFVGFDSLVIREVYRHFGILDDDLSSIVYVFDPRHPDGPEPVALTLRQVEGTCNLHKVHRIYIVENPSVFSTLVDQSFGQNTGSLLLCTSGPASAAALRLLDRYVQEGLLEDKVYYSGDYDLKGLDMANVLAERYSSHFHPWRYDAETYQQYVNKFPGPELTEEECVRLKRKSWIWCEEVCEKMVLSGRKLYQEAFLPVLANDWLILR